MIIIKFLILFFLKVLILKRIFVDNNINNNLNRIRLSVSCIFLKYKSSFNFYKIFICVDNKMCFFHRSVKNCSIYWHSFENFESLHCFSYIRQKCFIFLCLFYFNNFFFSLHFPCFFLYIFLCFFFLI